MASLPVDLASQVVSAGAGVLALKELDGWRLREPPFPGDAQEDGGSPAGVVGGLRRLTAK